MNDQTLGEYCESRAHLTDPHEYKCSEGCKFYNHCDGRFQELKHLTVEKAIERLTNPLFIHKDIIEEVLDDINYDLPKEIKDLKVALGQDGHMIAMTVEQIVTALQRRLTLPDDEVSKKEL